jgi:hypothetical protein
MVSSNLGPGPPAAAQVIDKVSKQAQLERGGARRCFTPTTPDALSRSGWNGKLAAVRPDTAVRLR